MLIERIDICCPVNNSAGTQVFFSSLRSLLIKTFIALATLSLAFPLLIYHYMDPVNSDFITALKEVWAECDIPKCCESFTEEVWRGTWRDKPHLTADDVMRREDMDTRIRIYNNWPPVLFRNDSR